MTARAPRIGCLDLDTFFVSVERLFEPSLVGKPVIVGGGPGKRGVVTSASYEVRPLGVHAGMPLVLALRLAPDAIVVPGRHGAYSEYSARVREVLERFCPLVQAASIDEFFLDLGGCERLYRRAGDRDDDATVERAVRELTATILEETGLPASAGIATSRPVCKIASGIAKPRGVLLVPAGREAEWLAPLPVRKYPGVGPVAEARLAALGITTLGELARTDPERLGPLGQLGAVLPALARGEGAHEVGPDRPAFREHDPEEGGEVGSISNERTFAADLGDRRRLESVLCALAERVCWRARKRGVLARTVTLRLRFADFETISRARTVAPTCSELELHPVLCALLAGALREDRRRRRVRLLGVALSRLAPAERQLGLFAWPGARVHRAVDGVRKRYGFDAIRLAESEGLHRG
jgi:DNA polymerase-4